VSPFECLSNHPPNYESLKVFGCTCFVLLQPHEYTKLEARARICFFLGYGTEHKGYRCWDPISHRIRLSRHVVSWEHIKFSSVSKFESIPPASTPFFSNSSIALFPSESDASSSSEFSHTPDAMTISCDEVSLADPARATQELATSPAPIDNLSPSDRPHRVSNRPQYLHDYHCFSAMLNLHEPQACKEASNDSRWQQAIYEELQAFEKTHTWDLVDRPPDKPLVGCKWIYKIKT